MAAFKLVSYIFLFELTAQHFAAGGKENVGECEVCIAVIDKIESTLTKQSRASVEGIEEEMSKFCKTAKGKEATMCYYMGIAGDNSQGTAGGVKREISSSMARGVNGKRLCKRLMKKDAQMCELRYEKKVDLTKVDLNKMRVKELRKVMDEHEIPCVGCSEKAELIRAIRAKLGLKDEV